VAEVRAFIENILKLQLERIASVREMDVMAIYGPMNYGLPATVKDVIEHSLKPENNDKLTILLDTGGGLVDSVERTVEIIRYHYDQVDFIVPDQAMSAGTIFALSGDNIYMDYYSQLGPIDPQFLIDGRWIPGLAYLEKFEELNKKARNRTLTSLEFGLAEKLDLADLHRFEQAREHSVELLVKWLPKYKFKNWEKNSTGETITSNMKQARAEKIAKKLNDTTRWHAHHRGITMNVLRNELELVIEDLNISQYSDLKNEVKQIHSFIRDFMLTSELGFILRLATYRPKQQNKDS